MYKAFLVMVALFISTSSFAAVESLTCQISGLDILNDKVISGYSQVRVSDTDLKAQIFIEIDVISSNGETFDSTKYVDNISFENFESANEIIIPKFQYFNLALVKNRSSYALKMTDDQSGQSHLAPINCSIEKKK